MEFYQVTLHGHDGEALSSIDVRLDSAGLLDLNDKNRHA